MTDTPSLALGDKPVVRYEKKRGHIIYKLANGRRVPGVTRIAKIGDDAEPLIAWANDMGLQGLDFRKVRDEAGDAGSLAHFIIVAHLEGKETDLSEASPLVLDLATNAVIKFLDFWSENKLSFVSAETPLVSELYRFGGTRDILARDAEGRLCLIDNKTGSAIRRAMTIQLAAYEALHNENSEELIMRRAIFRIGKKEKGDAQERWFAPDEMEAGFAAFRCQLDLYNALKSLK